MDETTVAAGFTWYLGPRHTQEAPKHPWLQKVEELEQAADQETAKQEEADEPDPEADPGVVVFTDPETGHTWVRPGWLTSGAGLALMAALFAAYRRAHAMGVPNPNGPPNIGDQE